MDITFGDKKIKKYAEDESLCRKKLGDIRSKLFLKRIGDLLVARTLEDVRYLPGHYHELVENRKGQWACDLDQPYRLIFIPHEDPVPTDANGKYIWIEIKGVEIVEIENYHGK
jgi:proteic killer suppression protein